jgi:phosphatidylglycerophosphatase A
MKRLQQSFFWTSFIPAGWDVSLATLGPIGRVPKAPGTWGSVAGLGLYAAVFHSASFFTYLILLAGFTYFAMAICDAAERRLQMRDPGMIVLDEFIALPVVFFGMGGPGGLIAINGGWPVLIGGFLLFRFFDIIKPFGIKRLQNLPGGIGCVVDDLAAGFLSCICLHLIFRYLV